MHLGSPWYNLAHMILTCLVNRPLRPQHPILGRRYLTKCVPTHPQLSITSYQHQNKLQPIFKKSHSMQHKQLQNINQSTKEIRKTSQFKILPYQDKLATPLRSQCPLELANTTKCPCLDLVQIGSVQNSGRYQQSKKISTHKTYTIRYCYIL